MNYLNESYGGMQTNPHNECGFVCYTIYDIKNEKYYSGVKSYKGKEHPVGKTYFTSSTVKDFKENFKAHPENFTWVVEYFYDLKSACEAEKTFHNKHNVGKNKLFYNAIAAGGSTTFGVGSVLCKSENNKTYRVSSEEYKSGNHKHVCNNRMLVYINGSDKLTSISKDDFDENIMKTQFSDHVLCYDNIMKKNRKIPRNTFLEDPERYTGVTKGKITVFCKNTNEKITIDSNDYDKNLYYSNSQSKTFKVIDLETNNIISIPVEIFHQNKHKYKHYNASYINRIDLTTMKRRKIHIDEYNETPNIFADLRAKFYLIYEGKIYRSLPYLCECFNLNKQLSLKSVIKILGPVEKVNIEL